MIQQSQKSILTISTLVKRNQILYKDGSLKNNCRTKSYMCVTMLETTVKRHKED